MARTKILTEDGARRMMSRLAYEVAERNEDLSRLDIFGIRRRGYAVAEALAEHIGAIEKRDFFVNDLDVTPFRDDRNGFPDGVRDDRGLGGGESGGDNDVMGGEAGGSARAETGGASESAAPPGEGALNAQAHITGRDVLLVDDVLFTGRTARAALDAVLQYGRPRSIQLVVLIDRGHREYPIQPDYTGRTIPTKHRERVVVEAEKAFEVYIEE